jgi:hypothetical protein
MRPTAPQHRRDVAALPQAEGTGNGWRGARVATCGLASSRPVSVFGQQPGATGPQEGATPGVTSRHLTGSHRDLSATWAGFVRQTGGPQVCSAGAGFERVGSLTAWLLDSRE